MSSAVVSTSAALGRPFLFDDEPELEVCLLSAGKKPSSQSISQVFQSTIPLVTPASRLGIRPAPEMAISGIPALDAFTGGLPRGCLTELCGSTSSGRTSVMLAALAAATRRGEYCALIDASDTLDPHSLAAASVDLDHLLWVRCNENSPQRHKDTEKTKRQKEGCPTSRAPFAREACPEFVEGVGIFEPAAFNFDRTKPRAFEHRLEQVLRATDLLLESGGFGLIILDLADVPYQSARRIPLTTWFRFRRAVEHKPTILLALEQQPIAGSCSSLLLRLGSSIEVSASYESAAKRQKNAAHGVSRGETSALESQAPEWRKKTGRLLETPYKSFLSHARLFTGLHINVELTRSRLNRKPACAIAFETKTAWAG